MAENVSILQGNTFVVSDRRGNMDASPTETMGLFHMDTRFLSRWRLTINGLEPQVLSTDDVQYFQAVFFLVIATGTIYVDSKLSVFRSGSVGGGFHEDLVLLNHGTEAVDLDVRIDAASDFADLFEVKDQLAKKGQSSVEVDGEQLVLSYRRDRFLRETVIGASAPEARFDEGGISFRVHLPPQERWSTCLDVRRSPSIRTATGRPDPKSAPISTPGSPAPPPCPARGGNWNVSTAGA